MPVHIGVYATSRHIPGVRFAGVSHPGLIGTAPSAELLATWNKREGELVAANKDVVPPVALLPEPKGAYVGQDLPDDLRAKIYKEGARTVPGREHGGNCDVRTITTCEPLTLIVLFTLSDQEPVEVRGLQVSCVGR